MGRVREPHADVICNQSRKQASEFISGDADGDSDSVRRRFGSLSHVSAPPRLTRDAERRRNRVTAPPSLTLSPSGRTGVRRR